MTNTPERRAQIGAFFAANANRVQNAVRRSARAPEQTIEDACQVAWTILLRRDDITLDARGLAWLVTVATHEAWRQASTASETPAGSFQGGANGDDAEQMLEPADPDDRSAEQRALARIEHDDRVDAVKTLKPLEREALYMKALGYSYPEIAKLTNSTYTAVNRRITEGRAALRRGGRQPRDRQDPAAAAAVRGDAG